MEFFLVRDRESDEIAAIVLFRFFARPQCPAEESAQIDRDHIARGNHIRARGKKFLAMSSDKPFLGYGR